MTDPATRALTSDQRQFVKEFLIDLNATAAARRMGIKEQEVRKAGSHLLRAPEVTKAIGKELAARAVANLSLASAPKIVLAALTGHIAIIEALKGLAFRRGYLVKRLEVSDLYGSEMFKESPDAAEEIFQAHHHDRCFYCYGSGPISHRILTGGDWDAHLKEILRQEARRYRTGTVVEVGANIGASFLPQCGEMAHLHFVMFEPNPAFYKLLERNKESFQLENVELFPYAVSDGESDDVLLLTDDVSGGVAAVGVFSGHYSTVVSKATSLDQHFAEENIILIKVDVDGFELDVLRGAERLIRRCRPSVLLEFSEDNMKARGVLPETLLELLADLGVGVFGVYAGGNGDFIEQTSEPSRVLELAQSQPPPYSYVDIHAHGVDRH